jgi:hypothetical protein
MIVVAPKLAPSFPRDPEKSAAMAGDALCPLD